MSGNRLNKKDHCDIDLWPSDFKINTGHVLAKTNQHLKYEIFVINKPQDNELKTLLFLYKIDPCDFEFWPSEPKIKRVLVLTKINQYGKYNSYVIYCFQDNDRKPFGLPMDGRTDGQTDEPTDRH